MKYLIGIATALALTMMVILSIVIYNVSFVGKVVNTSQDTTGSTLTVQPNYGEQKTAPSTVLQNAPNTVQNTATGESLQPATACLQGC